ncbi:hypothetical protein [Streptomyces sp. NPDC001750]|uniref:hypothetical protein n=1 Tax=Streptomyces sp. NPDC001750 TaxID=3364607 RepID=UPI00367ABF3A
MLYDCQPTPRSGRSLVSHRKFAAARDWTIVEELSDTAPLGTPAMRAPLWPRVAELIDSGQVDGVVTSAWGANDEVQGWLLERHAFTACIGAVPNASVSLPEAG